MHEEHWIKLQNSNLLTKWLGLLSFKVQGLIWKKLQWKGRPRDRNNFYAKDWEENASEGQPTTAKKKIKKEDSKTKSVFRGIAQLIRVI